MNIYIDESGSFVTASQLDAWNCVGAYISPEIDTRPRRKALALLKRSTGVPSADELKLRDIPEEVYFGFLGKLIELNGFFLAIATDAGRDDLLSVLAHQREQVEKILKNKPRMLYKEGQRAIQLLADEVAALSPQLYVQLHCQTILINEVIRHATLYFVQRLPQTLGRFRWRIDQKNTAKNKFEEAFEKVTPPLIQSFSIVRPLIMLEGADYSAFYNFYFPEGERPDYLRTEYGLDVDSKLDVGKIVREDLKFCDSKENEGVQTVDLLVSGLRRCLRGGFYNNQHAAALFGRLMVQAAGTSPPLRLIGFSKSVLISDSPAEQAVLVMRHTARGMLKAGPVAGRQR